VEELGSPLLPLLLLHPQVFSFLNFVTVAKMAMIHTKI
jgi:hypothetical protein